ncbi:UNKNOWN [Stylonychia lemnae]|uniref:Uncharacterized protein n=1 Tax=Stylonychia lemnae TaxID=5949 RepID=A0A078B653_STYLE|nr:UNKNOWN [Stylonychia lemnae]|eukprot:CDW89706.1 UNKNOWN [Stylonychia lemnae]
MERSNKYKQEKYKRVNDEVGGKSWIKEAISPDNTQRHQIQTGPRGGQYFDNSSGRKVYTNTVSHVVNVYPENSFNGTTPQEKIPYFGYGNKKKDKQ